ncbi:flagellar protein FlaG [Pseudemcibacter aquimaris]|uniref:flagellar protein FlaG n=1 Tax=Pseudemcibacter aquimaris TaxID=2857064 RepID=UPI0020119D5E|nr:flagellar protein FlaG [Pseudemcibacter aquimaris]MCC3860801.1 flagellar protein FlaG [Pseudemcibacter aquimaris]WDU59621.1 flagellar protein FlaG [Pseudemcibacter aquimaris]
MVDGLNTYGAGATVAGVVQQAATPQKREGGAATEKTEARPEETKADQAQTIKNLLAEETKGKGDFISQAEAILNKALSLKSINTKLSIDVDDGSGLFVYKGIDKKSGEVVSQFPAEEILALISYYREAEGLVVDETA